MKSAIRSGDFKLYKRYETNDYELYRLYQDGERLDLEEMNDLAKNPEHAAVVERLGKTLEAELVAHHAELPYLNPNYTDKKKPAATLGKQSFKESSRRARLAVELSGPKVNEAWVIYCHAPSAEKKKERRGSSDAVTTEFIPGMRLPATLSEDGSKVSAVIPESIAGYCFMLVDANGFMQFSAVAAAR